jgi:CheY-like chemotaxis protein
VQQILAFSRRQEQQLVVRALRPLIEETLALLRATLPAGVAMQVRLAEEPLHVLADSTQMQQVLMNLCTNAWHALPGGLGCIGVGLEPVLLDADAAPALDGLARGRCVHVWVSDDGNGMDEATRARIFEPFFTTKPVGHGTGLGLSVVHGIVTAHRGAIRVESELGRGSTFHLYFPLVDAAEAEAASGFGTLRPARGQGEHVLYIDDDEVMVLLAERLLQRAGYRVTSCSDPQAALVTVAAQPNEFDVVVSDFNMPGMSGIDLAHEIRRIRPELPVIIGSGLISEAMRADALAAGVRHLMHKENAFSDLAPLVHRALTEAAG